VQAAPRFPSLGLALVEWDGAYENHTRRWLRWATLDGALISTGAERAKAETERAKAEAERAERAEEQARRLAERLRALGVDPEAESD